MIGYRRMCLPWESLKTMASATFSRPPGFYDRAPTEAAEAAATIMLLQNTMSRFGYQAIDVPLIEYADLFLTKAGDESVSRLFNFELHGRQLCLRPEFTASAARLYIERYQHEPKPIRWQVSGPVFRYESPQRSHSRQFTMLGAELIGVTGAGADAETIGMAAQGLFAAGLRDWTLAIGHVGLVTQLLDRFNLDRRMRRFLLGHIENLRRPDRGRAYVESRVREQVAGLPPWLETEPTSVAELSGAVQLFLESANLNARAGGRSSEEIARRLLNKQSRTNQLDELARALDFLEALSAISGSPESAFAALDRLLPDDPAIRATADQFRAAIDLLPAYGIAPEQIDIQMGLARGLNYYTGLVFEAHTGGDAGADQLCGGGRYDEFIRLLGASASTPAIGFAYGLERILSERERLGLTLEAAAVRVLVVALDEAHSAEAARAATYLRSAVSVELFTPPATNLSAALARANRGGILYTVIVGAAEHSANQVTLRDMRAETQTVCTLAEALTTCAQSPAR